MINSTLHVLMLEDNPDDVLLIKRELTRAGFRPALKVVQTETDYLGALSTDWDIVLADYNLPGYDATRALEELRERGYDVPFILISGTLSEEVAVEIMRRGATDYLLKDRLIRLGSAVNNAIEERRSRQVAARERAKAQELIHQLDRERALNEQRKRLVEFATHELKQPLTNIQSSAENLLYLYDRMSDERRRQLLEVVYANSRRMVEMIQDMLVLGRLDEGITAITPIPLELDVITLGIVDQFRNAHPDQTIVCHIDPADYHLTGDNKLIHQIIENVLSNAVRYSVEHRPIDVRLERREQILCLTVTDRGIGIPLEDQPTLFEPYHRGSNVEGIAGTGLGLAIIKRAVELHGGSIHLHSQPGHGTTLTITLPSANAG